MDVKTLFLFSLFTSLVGAQDTPCSYKAVEKCYEQFNGYDVNGEASIDHLGYNETEMRYMCRSYARVKACVAPLRADCPESYLQPFQGKEEAFEYICYGGVGDSNGRTDRQKRSSGTKIGFGVGGGSTFFIFCCCYCGYYRNKLEEEEAQNNTPSGVYVIALAGTPEQASGGEDPPEYKPQENEGPPKYKPQENEGPPEYKAQENEGHLEYKREWE